MMKLKSKKRNDVKALTWLSTSLQVTRNYSEKLLKSNLMAAWKPTLKKTLIYAKMSDIWKF